MRHIPESQSLSTKTTELSSPKVSAENSSSSQSTDLGNLQGFSHSAGDAQQASAQISSVENTQASSLNQTPRKDSVFKFPDVGQTLAYHRKTLEKQGKKIESLSQENQDLSEQNQKLTEEIAKKARAQQFCFQEVCRQNTQQRTDYQENAARVLINDLKDMIKDYPWETYLGGKTRIVEGRTMILPTTVAEVVDVLFNERKRDSVKMLQDVYRIVAVKNANIEVTSRGYLGFLERLKAFLTDVLRPNSTKGVYVSFFYHQQAFGDVLNPPERPALSTPSS